jgi:hypothetical protein
VIVERLVEFGDKVCEGRAMSVENVALVPDYRLRKSVAFYGRWLVFGLGVVRRGKVHRSWYLYSISKAPEGARGLILESLQFLIYHCHHQGNVSIRQLGRGSVEGEFF